MLSWIAGLFFLALRAFFNSLAGSKKIGKYIWWLPFACLTLAVCAMAYAPLPFGWGSIGGLLAGLVGWLLGLLGGLFGAGGELGASILAGVLIVVALLFGLKDLIKDQKPDGAAKTMVLALPVLVLVATSPISAQIQEAITVIGGVGPDVVARIGG